MNITRLLKNLFKTELLLSILFLVIPFVLPLTSGVMLNSISEYAYATNSTLFLLLLTFAGYLIVVDGLTDETRRYNIILGALLVGVTLFPVGEFRVLHDAVAILFFLGNSIILTYWSKLVPKWLKISTFIIIGTVVGSFLFGIISLFIAESLGFLMMSIFMFYRYIAEWERIK